MKDCIFCKIVNGEIPSKVVYEDDDVIAFMDVNPQVDGHTLVIPKKHVTDFMDLTEDQQRNIFGVAKKLTPRIMERLNVKAMTMGCNYGDSQAVKHFHLHLLPNYFIDDKVTNVDDVYNKIKQ